jgi:hypothetical protein
MPSNWTLRRDATGSVDVRCRSVRLRNPPAASALTRALFGAGALLLGACGAAHGPALPGAPASEVESRHGTPADLDELEAALAKSRRELDDYLAASPSGGGAASRAGAREAPRAPEPVEAAADEQPETESAPAAGAPSQTAGEPSPGKRPTCDLACRALAAMERAADRICAITGEPASRCRTARDQVRAATLRVIEAPCACPDD